MSDVKKNFPIWKWVKALSVLVMVIFVCAKIYAAPITIAIDFPTFLSLVLALFSVALSALFYFKATDTSNAFYDNTYKFTKDIAELLVKIESGFGERLKHLDEGYTSMRDYFQNGASKPTHDVEDTKNQLATEKQEIEKVRAERDEIVRQLIEKSQLQQEEKDKITQELRNKEDELTESQRQVSRLNRHLTVERMARRRGGSELDGMEGFTADSVIRRLGIEPGSRLSSRTLRNRFNEIVKELPRGYIVDMEARGYFDGELTPAGVNFFRDIMEKMR